MLLLCRGLSPRCAQGSRDTLREGGEKNIEAPRCMTGQFFQDTAIPREKDAPTQRLVLATCQGLQQWR